MHIVSGYIGSFTYFLFWGGWGQPSHSERTWVQRTSQWKELGQQHPEEKKPNSMSFWVNTQVGKETYLNFHSSSQLLKNVLPEPLDLISLQFGQPNLYDTWDEPAKPDHDQEIFYPREGDNFKNKQTEISVSSTARDFQLDSHVTSLPIWGNKISDETAITILPLVDKKRRKMNLPSNCQRKLRIWHHRARK